MKPVVNGIFAFTALLSIASTSFAASTTMTIALPDPNIYYTALADINNPNYLITDLSFTAGIIRYQPGGDINADLQPYFDIAAQDSFTYDAKSCILYNSCNYFTGTSSDSASTSNYPNIYQTGDQLDANFQFRLYQPQHLSFGVTSWNDPGPYTLQLRDASNNLVTPDSNGIYALSGSSYDLEFIATFDSTATLATITGSAAVSAVPVPAAVWLFCSGFIGLAGIAGMRKVAVG